MVNRKTRGALAVLLLATVSLAAGPAAALSFSIPVGRTVEDIDLSTGGGLTYDGTAETLTITTDVDALRLDDGSTVSLSAGQLVFSLSVTLVGAVSTTTLISDTFHDADFSNGAFDFTIMDTQNTAAPGDDELVLGADFTGNLHLFIQETFFGTTGDLGGDAQGGKFAVTWLNAALAGQVPLSGDLSAFLTNYSPMTNLADGGGGFVDHTAQPNVDVNLPEPGLGGLAVAVLLATAGVARRRR